jgi:hypothetical protein
MVSLEVLLEIYLIKITSAISGKEFTKTVKGQEVQKIQRNLGDKL